MTVANVAAESIEPMTIQEEANRAIDAVRMAAAHGFAGFDAERLRTFMQIHGRGLANILYLVPHDDRIRGKRIPKDALEIFSVFESVLVERGLLYGNRRLTPALPTSAFIESSVSPYAVTRLVYYNFQRGEQLLFMLDGEGALLSQEDRSYESIPEYWIDKPCSYSFDRLALAPERFIQWSQKLEVHWRIEMIAYETLSGVLTRNPLELTLQYAGYPSKAEKDNAEVNKQKLQEQVGICSPWLHALPAPKDNAEVNKQKLQKQVGDRSLRQHVLAFPAPNEDLPLPPVAASVPPPSGCLARLAKRLFG